MNVKSTQNSDPNDPVYNLVGGASLVIGSVVAWNIFGSVGLVSLWILGCLIGCGVIWIKSGRAMREGQTGVPYHISRGFILVAKGFGIPKRHLRMAKVDNGYYCTNVLRPSDSTDKIFRMFIEEKES